MRASTSICAFCRATTRRQSRACCGHEMVRLHYSVRVPRKNAPEKVWEAFMDTFVRKAKGPKAPPVRYFGIGHGAFKRRDGGRWWPRLFVLPDGRRTE